MHRTAATILLLTAVLLAAPQAVADDEPIEVSRHPPMMTVEAIQAIRGGVDYLRKMQRSDGSWMAGGRAGYPAAMTSLAGLALAATGSTPTRGPHAAYLKRGVKWLLDHQDKSNGLIAGQREQRHMYGHGFAMLFLGTIHGSTGDAQLQKRIHKALKAAVELTARAQSADGGWYYTHDSRNDEGSVTVTQMQGLRAARNAGVLVPDVVIQKAVAYLKACQMPDGGICYSKRSRGRSREALAAAAVACMYSAGFYDDPIAEKALAYCKAKFGGNPYGGNFFFYTNFYLTQVMYLNGNGVDRQGRQRRDWESFYPKMRQSVLTTRYRTGNTWNGSGFGTGPVYGTSLAVIILAMPYKNLPIFHR